MVNADSPVERIQRYRFTDKKLWGDAPDALQKSVALPRHWFETRIPAPSAEIAKQLDLNKTQVHTWLKCSKLEGRVIRKTSPVRYSVPEDGKKQKSLQGL